MKKIPPARVLAAPVAARRGFIWPTVAVVSVMANVALGVMVWRGGRGEGEREERGQVARATAKQTGEARAYAALGSFMAENNRIADLHWTPAQFEAFLDGFRSNYAGHPLPLDEEARALQASISQRVQMIIEAERPNPVEEYFKTLREKEGVAQTASGLHYRITEPGFGPTPTSDDTVVMSFAAQQPDGTKLPSISRVRTRSAVKDLLPGLAEGVQLLRAGGKALIYLPPALAFSEENWPADLPHGMPVTFFVELHEIVGSDGAR